MGRGDAKPPTIEYTLVAAYLMHSSPPIRELQAFSNKVDCLLNLSRASLPTPSRQRAHIYPGKMLSRLTQQRAIAQAQTMFLRRRISPLTSKLPKQTRTTTQIQPSAVQKRTLISAPKPGDGPLMERRPDRELPSTVPLPFPSLTFCFFPFLFFSHPLY